MITMKSQYPERIVCLTDETTEVLYLLGEEDRIAGISGFTVRPPRARKEKPKVSTFTSVNIDKILDLRPDIVFGFSDLQADIVKGLVGRGLQVHVFNQRSVEGIFNMIRMVGAMVGATKKSEILIRNLNNRINSIKRRTDKLIHRPLVYFEEWGEPLITGIGWVSELIEIAGGTDCFGHLAKNPLAKDRVIKNSGEVVQRRPDIIIGSWCGKRFRPDEIRKRKDWNTIPAVQDGHVYEIKSSDILQPGPAALTDGLDQLHKLISQARSSRANLRIKDKE